MLLICTCLSKYLYKCLEVQSSEGECFLADVTDILLYEQASCLIGPDDGETSLAHQKTSSRFSYDFY